MSRGLDRPGIWAPAGLACSLGVVFSVLFRAGRLGPFDFWWGMALAIAFATALGLVSDRGYAGRLCEDLARGFGRKVGLGVASAAILYAVFAVGRAVALKILPFAGAGIDSVYSLKSGAATLRIVLLLILIIGPGEELFWRGFLQENVQKRFGKSAGLALTAAVYTAVHIASGNVMLILAAGVCGIFWGWMYTTFRSTLLNAVSHTVWDLLVFVLFPF